MLSLSASRRLPSTLARAYASAPPPSSSSSSSSPKPPSLLSLADLTPLQITKVINKSASFKASCRYPATGAAKINKTLSDKTVALLFSKRSTRTRVASETSVKLLGGHSMFLGSSDVQLGVNESLTDTSRVLGSMVDGIMARVGDHSEVETLAKESNVPVINALSSLWHPTQTLASLLTLARIYKDRKPSSTSELAKSAPGKSAKESWSTLLHQDPTAATADDKPKIPGQLSTKTNPLECLKGLKVAWVGDCNNVVNDMIVTYPRLGIDLRVACPGGKDGEYGLDPRVWAKLEEFGATDKVLFTSSPEEALKDADVVVTDTWISMGQEEESAKRLQDFSGFQITEELCKRSGASPDWKFMHCLPRHTEEVDDEVFYGPRSTVFEEAENRKWTIMSLFHSFMGKRSI